MKTVYADINKFCFKPLLPFKNFYRYNPDSLIHPLFSIIFLKNLRVFKELQKNNFFEEILNYNKPSAFITLGNDFFMRKLYNHLNNIYNTEDTIKPAMFHYDRTHYFNNLKVESILDYHFSILNNQIRNFE